MLYVFVLPEQMVALPVIAPGEAGAVAIVTARICAEDVLLQPLAATETFPPVEFAVAFMEVVVEVPVQPLGIVQV